MQRRFVFLSTTLAMMVLSAFAFNNCADPKIVHVDENLSVTVDVKGKLCSNPLAEAEAFTMDSFNVVNMTMAFDHGRYLADSDADGLPDEIEASLGYDPLKRRSNGAVLDGICRFVGGPEKCEQYMAQSTCQRDVNGAGLSDCDVRILDLHLSYAHPDQGVDTDKDGVLDVVELSRGLQPARDDMGDDSDGDGIQNQVEIVRGLDPRSPDAERGSTQTIEVVRENDASCTGSSYKFSILNFSLANTKAYENKSETALVGVPEALDFSHKAGENIILITYKSVPLSQASTQAKVWGAIFRVSFGKALPISVTPADFHLLGTVLK